MTAEAYLEAFNSILQARHQVHVRVHGLVANIALDKNLSRSQTQDLVCLCVYSKQAVVGRC